MVNYPDDWKIMKLKDIAEYRRGSFPQPYDNPLWYGGINSMPFVQVADISDDMKLCEKTKTRISRMAMPKSVFVEKGTLVCSIQGSIGRAAITQYNCYIDRTIAIFKKFKIDINQKYFMYQLKRKFDIEKENAKGSTIKTITIAEFGEFSIGIPILKEQQAIADTLSAFDEHIDNLNKLIEKKKAIRNGVLEELMSGKIRVGAFKEEWEEAELSNICKIYDGTHQTPKYTLHGIRFVSVEDIMNLYDTNKFISYLAYNTDFKAYPEKGDILMTRIGDIGTPCVVKNNEPLAYYVSLALFKNITVNSEFLKYYIMSKNFKKELDDRTLHHATPKKINKCEIGKCKVKFPKNNKEQQAIAEVLTAMDEEIISLEKEVDKIKQINEGALNELLTGQVRLSV